MFLSVLHFVLKNVKIAGNHLKEVFVLDENRNDELQTEAQDTPETEGTNSQLDDLVQELEGIRDMFQEELDAAGNAEEGELIQELELGDDSDFQEEDVQEEASCECCGENPRSKEHGEDYPYCDSCRELMKRYPLRFSGIFMILVMIAVFMSCIYFSMDKVTYMETLAESAAFMNEGKVMSAMQGYYGYIQSADPETVSRRAVNDLLDGFIKTGYFSDASALVSSLYSDEELERPWNKKYADISKKAQNLTDTYYAVTEVCEAVLSGGDFDCDEVLEGLEALKSVNLAEEGEAAEYYDATFIDYYKFVTMVVAEKSLDEQLEQLRITAEGDKDGEMSWIYLSNYCGIAAKAGDEALTTELFEKSIKINKEDSNAYMALASYYRYAETPDPDKIIEICEQAKENAYSGDTSYQQYLAIAYMLKGEGALALEEMEGYMSTNSYSVQSCNLYALCGLYNGNTEIYDEMKSVLESSGYEISETVESYKAGEINITEALQDKEAKI